MVADPTRLQVDVSTGAGWATLVLAGDLDADSASSFLADAEQLVHDGHRTLVLDCAGVTFCDSFGLRAMARLADLAQPEGSVTVDNPSDTLARILDITGLAERFGASTASN